MVRPLRKSLPQEAYRKREPRGAEGLLSTAEALGGPVFTGEEVGLPA